MTKPRRRQAGEGGISAYKTKSGQERYLIKYQAAQADGTVRTVLRRRSRSGEAFLTRKAAAEELGDVLAEVRSGQHVIPKRMTTGEWLDHWVAGLQLAPSTVSSYTKNVRLHLKPAIGQVQLQHLTGARISGMYREMERGGRQDHRAGEGLSARTVRYVHTILKAALGDAVDQGLIATNPAAKAKPPSARSAKSPEIHPWTGRQLAAFLEWCRTTRASQAVAYHVLAYTGARRGEVLALRWRDLDLDAARLSIRRSVGVVKTKGQPELLVEGPTKSARPRVIDLDAGTIETLRRWRLERAQLSLQLVKDDALIFATIEGTHLHPERFSRLFGEKVQQCRRKLGDEGPPLISVHDLRHTHASLLLAAGEQIKVVSERLGHASVAITHEIYEHVIPGMQAAAAARFAALVEGGAS